MTIASLRQHEPASLQALLSRLIDYAGLFPPASLDMCTAVANYGDYAAGERSWMLGRFILPAGRLAEFECAQRDMVVCTPWTLSALVGPDIRTDLDAIVKFNRRNDSRAIVDTVEAKFGSYEQIKIFTEVLAPSITAYCEVPLSTSVDLLARIGESGARAKIRMGGIQASAIPQTSAVARFISSCAAAGTPLKATAGLHHPLRRLGRLTYEANAPSSKMHGFLNLFLAMLFAVEGATQQVITCLLKEEQARNISFSDSEARWMTESIRTHRILADREKFAISFGSCSFDEPIHDLCELRFL